MTAKLMHKSEVRAKEPHRVVDGFFEKVLDFRFADGTAGRMCNRFLDLGDIRVGEVDSTGHEIALKETRNASLLFPVTGCAEVTLQSGQHKRVVAGGGLFLPPGTRTTTVGALAGQSYRAIVALVPAGDGESASARGIEPEAAGLRTLTGIFQYLISEGGRDDSLLAQEGPRRSARAMVQEILRAFARVGDDHVGAAPSRRVRRALDFMHAHSEEPLTVDEIAQAAGVGVRALQVAFREDLGKSPRQMLTEIRMKNARTRLLAPELGDTVTSIALASGFLHQGRFASAYAARYCEPPSETLRRAFGAGA